MKPETILCGAKVSKHSFDSFCQIIKHDKNVQLIKLLHLNNPTLCLTLQENGRTNLHAAADSGNEKMFLEVYTFHPEAISFKFNQDTISFGATNVEVKPLMFLTKELKAKYKYLEAL